MRRLTVLWFLVGLWVLVGITSAVAQPGSLDVSFGTDGTVTTQPARSGGLANAVAIQPDGKIVAAGGTAGLYERFALARYNPNGSLDPMFGDGGTVTTRFLRQGGVANAVVLQPDGKIVAAGGSFGIFPKFALARYNPDGSLDVTFGGDGRIRTFFTSTGAIGFAVAVQPDGKIVVAGAAEGGGLDASVAGFALARYDTDGSLDATFDGDGKVTTDFPGGHAYAVAIQADGRIVAAGEAGGLPALARYNTDGSLDATFDGDGKVTTEVDCCPVFVGAYGAAIQPDGKIVTAGEHFECFGGGGFSCEPLFILARYNSNGTLDPTFGEAGLTFGVFGSAYAVALQPDGRIVAAGAAGRGNKFAIARYDPNGVLDATFGRHGRVFVNFSPLGDAGRGVAIDGDGRIVAAGSASSGGHPVFALARILGS